MARRKKNRTHVPTSKTAPKDGTPKSFVIKAAGHGNGAVGSSVGLLVKDVRRVMEPNTASNLKERKSNRLRDYIAMAGPLGVTHMMVFSQSTSSSDNAAGSSSDSSANVNLRICRLPRGPTLTFKVLRYSLASDVLSASKRPRSPGKEFATEPLLILNNFNVGEDRELKLMTTMFQNLFPSLKVHSMHLSSARRVVLLSYNPVTRTIEFRHYLITVRPVGVSKAVRKIIEGSNNTSRARSITPAAGPKGKGKQVPNMAKANDVADYVLNAGAGFITSDSEADSDMDVDLSEGEDGLPRSRRIVELPQDFVGRGNRKGAQRAIRLTELGPRMELGLVKVEEGIGDGAVLFHEYIKKSKSEAAALAKSKAEQKQLAAKRRKEQEANVARKQEEKEAKKREKAEKRAAKRGEDGEGEEEGEETGEEEEEEEEESDLDDAEVERTVFGEPGSDDDEVLFDEEDSVEEDDDFGLGLDAEVGIDSDDDDDEAAVAQETVESSDQDSDGSSDSDPDVGEEAAVRPAMKKVKASGAPNGHAKGHHPARGGGQGRGTAGRGGARGGRGRPGRGGRR